MTGTFFTSRFAVSPAEASKFGTSELRANFLVTDLFGPDQINLTYAHYDRMIIGGANPVTQELKLETIKPTGTAKFLDRRELIVVNIGKAGTVIVDGQRFELGHRDMIYVGMGAVDVRFTSVSQEEAACFYLISAPAHQVHPTKCIGINDAKRVDLGSQATSNQRSIFQFIHPEGAKTCQLVVGMTTLAQGSVWNTMPAHVHDRRSEAYLYFGLADDARVVHLMGEPQETRHLIVADRQAVLSPGWSIHSGSGTSNYTFIWAMAGDNVDYTDVDPVLVGELA